MENDVETRLVDLESRLAHHERLAEELSDCLLEQGRTIELLRRQLQALRDRLGDLEAGGGWRPSPQDEKPPPHY